MKIPLVDLEAERSGLRPLLDGAIRRVLDRGWYVLGEEGRAFEREFALWLGAAEVVGVGSGTEALHLALAAEGIGPGDEVLTSPLTAAATACAIALAGARPAFADVDPRTGLLDPADAARRITPRCRAIVPVHLYGQCAPMEAILDLARARGLAVVEDAAQAHGATRRGRKAGTFGAAGCFSFYPTKNLGALGDAGAIAVPDPAKAERLRRMRNYGQEDRYRHVIFGWNSRLDEIQAAVLREKLRRLDEGNAARRALAARYQAALSGSGAEPLAEDPQGESVHHLFVVRSPRRDAVRESLASRGIETQVHYPIPVHLQPAFAHLGHRPGDFPAAEALADSVLSLPMHPSLAPSDADAVAEAVREALRRS